MPKEAGESPLMQVIADPPGILLQGGRGGRYLRLGYAPGCSVRRTAFGKKKKEKEGYLKS